MTTTEDMTDAIVPPRAWVIWLSWVIAFIGVGESVYLTVVHYRHVKPVCSVNKYVDCSQVITGPYSSAFNIPFAVLGLVFFVGLLLLNSPWAWRSQRRLVHWVRLGAAISGLCFVFYLVYIELVIKGKLCEWCTGVHLLTFTNFVIALATVPTMLGLWDSGETVELEEPHDELVEA
jgi:uncharacterized membrane protein